jgi:PAS domain S-box-containing protein
MAGVCVWLFGYGAELAVASLDEMKLWTIIQYPGIAILPAANLLFAFHYSGARDAPGRLGGAVLVALCVSAFLAVWTNDWHRLFYTSESVVHHMGMELHALEPGPLYWLFLLYSYTCVTLTAIMLARMQAVAPPRFAMHARWLLMALLVPLGLAVARAVGWRPFGVMDIVPFGFVATVTMVAVLLLRHRFLELGPLARDTVLDGLDHAVLVLDSAGAILDANAALLRTLNLAESPVGQSTDAVLGRWPGLMTACSSPERHSVEVVTDVGGSVRTFDVAVTPITDAIGGVLGRSLVWRDTTTARAAMDALHARDRLLEAQASATHALLVADDSEAGVNSALDIIGTALEVDRAYVFEDHTDPVTGATLTSQRFEWAAPGIRPMLEDPMLQNVPYSDGFSRWQAEFAAGRPIRGRVADFPEVEREFLRSQEITSLLAIPILVEGCPWGFIGFDECAEERQWTDAEASSLTVLAAAIGSAVLRNRAIAAVTASERRFRSYFDLPVAGTAICDGERRIKLANRRFAAILGCTVEEVRGLAWTDLLRTAEGAPLIADQAGLCAPAAPRILEARLLRRDGQTIDIELAAKMVGDPDGDRECLVMIQDVTDGKRYAAELQSLNETLNQRVQQRTMDLENANRELEAFAGSVSNDLRAPLRWIDGFSRVLAEEYAESLGAEGSRLVARVREAGEQMAERLDALLRVSNVSRMEMTCVRCDLSDMAQEIADELRAAEPARKVDVRIEPGLMAYGSPNLLRLALRNLMANAWKFTSKRPHAVIEIGSAPPPATEADGSESTASSAYYVRDNGAGFDPAYAHKLFGAFQRLHSESEFEGTGMGLAVVQRIIHRHGGDVSAEGELDRGATFTFTLPTGRERRQESRRRATQTLTALSSSTAPPVKSP